MMPQENLLIQLMNKVLHFGKKIDLFSYQWDFLLLHITKIVSFAELFS